MASLKRATELAPRNTSFALNLARAYMVGNDMKSALEVLDGVLKADPGHVPALAMAAAGSLRAGNVEKAAGYVERVRKIVPDSPGTYMLEGDLAMAQKRYADAVASYRKASDKAGSTTRELVLAEFQAATLAGESRPERGLEDWVAKHPDDTAVVTALGEVRHRDGDSAGAIKLYEQALQKAPDNAPLLNNLAVLYQDAGNPKAVETAERAYKLAPQMPAVQDTYGWILLGAGKAKEAVADPREGRQRHAGQCRGAVSLRRGAGSGRPSARGAARAEEGVGGSPAGQRPRCGAGAAGKAQQVTRRNSTHEATEHAGRTRCGRPWRFAPWSWWCWCWQACCSPVAVRSRPGPRQPLRRRPPVSRVSTASALATRCRYSSGTSRS